MARVGPPSAATLSAASASWKAPTWPFRAMQRPWRALEASVSCAGHRMGPLSLTGAPSQAQAEAGIETGLAGTSVATETCGQLRPLKFRKTS